METHSFRRVSGKLLKSPGNYDFGQNIIDKFTKFSKSGFSMTCFTADLRYFCSAIVKAFWEVD